MKPVIPYSASTAFVVWSGGVLEAQTAADARGSIGLDTDDNVTFATVTSTGNATANGRRLIEGTIYPAWTNYLYAVSGQEANLYFDNAFILFPAGWDVDVTCTKGRQNDRRWAFTPVDVTDVATDGTTTASFAISLSIGEYEPTQYTSTLRIAGSTNGGGASRQILPIGDSVFMLPWAEVINLFADGSGMTITTVGSQSDTENDSQSTSRTFDNESRSGWTWALFTGATSPFYSGGQVDYSAYETAQGISLVSGDWVLIHLGINDVGTQTSDSAVQAILDGLAAKIDSLVGTGASPASTTIRGHVSGVRIGLCVPIPCSADQDAFGAIYSSGTSRRRYIRNLQLYQKWLIDTYDNATYTARNIHVVPVHYNLDTVFNMSYAATATNARNAGTLPQQDNTVHPANKGYWQMADSLYAFLKYFA